MMVRNQVVSRLVARGCSPGRLERERGDNGVEFHRNLRQQQLTTYHFHTATSQPGIQILINTDRLLLLLQPDNSKQIQHGLPPRQRAPPQRPNPRSFRRRPREPSQALPPRSKRTTQTDIPVAGTSALPIANPEPSPQEIPTHAHPLIPQIPTTPPSLHAHPHHLRDRRASDPDIPCRDRPGVRSGVSPSPHAGADPEGHAWTEARAGTSERDIGITQRGR